MDPRFRGDDNVWVQPHAPVPPAPGAANQMNSIFWTR